MRKLAVVFALAAVVCAGQRHKAEGIDPEKPEGKLLQQIIQESDDAKKIPLLEDFAAKYSQGPGAGWALQQLQNLYLKAGQAAKAVAAGEKLLAIDPADAETALQTLKAAEAAGDAALVVKWSAQASALARKVAATPQPKEESETAAWKNEVDFARQVDTYSEYALFAAAMQSRDPKATIDLVESLEQRNPKSEYMVKAAEPLFIAYRQMKADDKALAIAERIVAVDQTNEDMLLMVAESYAQNKKYPEKAHAYAAKAVEIAGSRPRPEGIAEADWNNRRNVLLGIGYYVNGKLFHEEGQYARADEDLRKALDLLEASPAMKPEVLFLLGYANYKLGKAQDAANFYKACAAIKSPYQATAVKSLAGVKAEYKGVR